MTLESKRRLVAALSFFFLAALLIVAWVEGLKTRVDPTPEPVLLGVNEQCYSCHAEKSPSVTQQWNDSKHARLGVAYAEVTVSYGVLQKRGLDPRPIQAAHRARER